MEYSYVMIKPSYLQHLEEIKKRIVAIGGTVVKEKNIRIPKETLREHYAHVKHLDFYPMLEEYMTSDDCYAMIIKGESGIISKIREIVGPTKNSPAGTIRGDFMHAGAPSAKNVIHASDALESANAEIKRFFGDVPYLNKIS